MGDLLNSLTDAGFTLRRLCECPAQDSRYWDGVPYLAGSRPDLLDWRINPLAGLPVWLAVAAQKTGTAAGG